MPRRAVNAARRGMGDRRNYKCRGRAVIFFD